MMLRSGPVGCVAAPVATTEGGIVAWIGDDDARYRLASVTKLLTAAAVQVAAEEGTVALDQEVPLRSDGTAATIADLLAHAGGLGPAGDVLARPRTQRIYTNAGYELVAHVVARASGFGFADYLTEGVLGAVGMARTSLDGSPAADAVSTVADLARFVPVLATAGLLAVETVEAIRTPHLPALRGVLPGFGRQDPNPWGLGPEIRGAKAPHWTGSLNSPTTFGHFGQAGTFWWFDPVAGIALVVLTDRDFDTWAVELWPVLSDAVVAEVVTGGTTTAGGSERGEGVV